MKENKLTAVIAALILLAFYSCNQGQKVSDTNDNSSLNQKPQIYEWRGENRSGIYNETGLLTTWPDEGPKLVWEYEGIGNGYGSPVFTPEGMYIMGEIDSLAYLFAFDPEGQLMWKSDFYEINRLISD